MVAPPSFALSISAVVLCRIFFHFYPI